MMKIKALVTVVFLLHALANHAEEIGHATENVMKQGLEVSYDHRALIIDGQRRILISGSIHYPRSTPEMWPDLIAKAKDGGLDVIQTYVFWNGHEPVKGTYYFEGRYDLVQFVKVVKAAGLYVNLRIGPYVCAEWNFGGFPVWLRHIPGIAFRTNNEQFKNEMQGFVQKVVALMQQNELFAEQGGPIILAQIENEYGNIDSAFGEAGHEYMLWAASLVETLNTTIPWIMCDQADAPANIINTCNGYYCDGFVPNADNKPTIWTENWAGWFQVWEGLKPHRPAEDVAFAVARFYQRGGSFQNYYMYHGGTNFGRTSGGPFITTSYDYDAPLDEYGNKRQPKWGHLKDLHRAIKMTEPALVASDTYSLHVVLSEQQEVYVYSDVSHAASIREILAGSLCAAYISNQGVDDVTVTFNGHKYDVPGWSVTILPDCRTEVFNTAKVTAQTSRTELRRTSSSSFGLEFSQSAEAGLHWVSLEEPIGVSQKSAFSLSGLAEQIRTTGDRSDYLWYTTSVQVDETDPESNPTVLSIEDVRDGVHIFVNSKFAGRATGKGSNFSLDQPVNLTTGSNDIAVLCFTMGLQNYGAKLETWGAGIQGGVTLKGLPSGDKILSSSEWTYQVGLQGGRLAAYTEKDAQSVAWSSELPSSDQPLVWFKTRFDAPSGDDPVVINLGSMGKGQAWINGEHLGRYWVTARAPQDGCSTECDYRGAYTPAKCSSGCGEQSQTWYHVPRSWLQATSNLLVLFEEEGGNTSGIFFATSSTSSEFHSYSQASSKRSSTPPDGARPQCSEASSFHS